MAITINGTGTITGISAGGLPDGSVTAADIESSLDLTGKTVTLPSGTGGKILQVRQNVDAAYSNGSTNTTYSEVVSHTITPSSTSNSILILLTSSVNGESNTSDVRSAFKLQRNTTDIWTNTEGFMKTAGACNSAISYIDSPSTTSEITYRFLVQPTLISYGTALILKQTSITLIEVAA